MDAITVDNLLRHTSGIADYLDEPVPPDTNERVLEYAKQSQKLLFPPGTDYRYSN
jgi:CubicO group peptidase (beta-lactamase class C family)